MRILAYLKSACLAQEDHVFPWLPVGFGLGIWAYFCTPTEPTATFWYGLAGLVALCSAALWARIGRAPFWIGAIAIVMGGLWAWGSTVLAERPVITARYYGPVTGRVIDIDRSQSDALRLTLDQVILSGMPFEKTPHRVRMSLHGDQQWLVPQPHQIIGATAHLTPPSGPVEPGGFDFQRHSYFQGIGAVGYSRLPVLELAPPPKGVSLAGLRHRISAYVKVTLPGDIGGFAAAIITGDRSGISQDRLSALRATNLAHLLAISGLHMGLLAGAVFAATRFALCLLPPIALRLPVAKIAAGVALIVASFYLALSGASVATQRAYVMALVALMAVMFERQVFSLRAVALAALIVLILRPVSLMSVGFHMSFAATTALVWVFDMMRASGWSHWPKPIRWIAALILSSLVAGMATAPYAAATFNSFARYGLLANILAVPVMGTLVMPAAILAALLAPIGLAWIGLAIMGLGLRWILNVTDVIAGFPEARHMVAAPPDGVIPLLTLGALFILLWQGRLRGIGLVPVFSAGLFWIAAERPAILVAENGALLGIMTEQGRALSRAKGQGFVARAWLENDGDDALQERAAQRLTSLHPDIYKIPLAPHLMPAAASGMLWHIATKSHLAAFQGCSAGDILVTAHPLPRPEDLPCMVIDPRSLAKTGAVAIRRAARDGSFHIRPSRGPQRSRPWQSAVD